jgi:hypothetical protein
LVGSYVACGTSSDVRRGKVARIHIHTIGAGGTVNLTDSSTTESSHDYLQSSLLVSGGHYARKYRYSTDFNAYY